MNIRIVKFGTIAAVMIPVLIFFASCEFPQSARIKASPTFQIPIPLGEGTNNSFIRSYTDIAEIREKMTEDSDSELGKTLSIYEYKSKTLMEHFGIVLPEGSKPVQTYLITYPLFDMSLDFDKYLNGTLLDTDKSRVPQVDISIAISDQVARLVNQTPLGGGDLAYNRWIDPFMRNSPEVDLGDMKNLLSDITFNSGVSFSILVGSGNAEELQKAIRIRVPQLKIGDDRDRGETSWVQGELNPEKTILIFRSAGIDADEPLLLISDETNSKKASSEKVEIHIRLVNKIGAGQYETELNFDWNSVQVKPNDEAPREFKGFDLGSYLKSLGDDVEFEKAPAYLYVGTPSGFEGFTVSIDSIGAVTGADSFSLEKTDIVPEKDEDGTEQNLPLWLDVDPSHEYDFTDSVNTGAHIKYSVTPPGTVKLLSSEIDTDNPQKITVNLAVLLPMVFKFTGTGIQIADDTKTDENEGGTYYPVKFQGLDDFLGSGSSSSGDSSVMEELDKQLGEGGVNSLKLRLTDIDNKVTGPIYLAMATDSSKKNPGPEDWEIVRIASDAEDKDIDIKNVKSLSGLPPIKFLVKQESGPGNGGRLYIQSQDDKDSIAFSVKISVVAGINIDKAL
ncbi:MAG: hypothetical protein LBB83_05495 [Treponema sp.]|jgi:hypothetical protein|nr:hypothetical protein [Treponema sp.]